MHLSSIRNSIYCLIFSVKGIIVDFACWVWSWQGFVITCLNLHLGMFPLSHVAEIFSYECMLGFIKCFSTSINVIMWWIRFIDLWMSYLPCIPGIHSTWSWCMILVLSCCIQFANVSLVVFSVCVYLGHWPKIFFLVVPLSHFGNRIMKAWKLSLVASLHLNFLRYSEKQRC